MDVYRINSISELIKNNSYAGRGVIIGKTPDGKKAAIGYFIMGRSENSRNRIFEERGDELFILPFDESKVEDPTLIIYRPIRVAADSVIVTNGDQTDTIYDYVTSGKTFTEALDTRCFEPDAPNYTPRISGIIDKICDDFTYEMSILKSLGKEGEACGRYYYRYESLKGLGHFIHTYEKDGNPLPTFRGEPLRISIADSIDDFTEEIWESLDRDNRISLYTRYIDLETGRWESRLINGNA